MFLLTPALKRFAVKHLGVKADAKDSAFKAAVAKEVAKGAKGKLSAGKLAELTKSKASGDDAVDDYLKRQIAKILAKGGKKPAGSGDTGKKPAKKKKTKKAPTELEKEIAKGVTATLSKLGIVVPPGEDGASPEAVFGGAARYLSHDKVRVKSASESYDNTRKGAICPMRCGRDGTGTAHPLAGQQARFATTNLDHPSDLDKAVAGAYFKFCLERGPHGKDLPRSVRMTDHDRDLVNWSLRSMPWSGLIKTDRDGEGEVKVNRRKLTELEVKALLDDSVSGGIEAAPIAFDDAIVLIPVLFGELFPLVNVVNVTRGRRMKGAAMQNPTFTSGVAEGTAITPFNTAAFVSAFDTTIYPAVAAMEIGLDFEEDSPVDLGGQIIENYGLKALEYLDRVIAVGDGVVEPLGIFNTSGTAIVNSDNGAGGPATVSDYEGLMFGIPKQFRNEAGSTTIFLANDTMYRRAKAIPVGAGDQRRVFGMDHAGYTLLDRPYKINNSIANGKVAFVNMRRYRMYRRLGLNVRVETAGRTLALSNTKLIVLRMRFGGQLEVGGAAAIMSDAQQ